MGNVDNFEHCHGKNNETEHKARPRRIDERKKINKKNARKKEADTEICKRSEVCYVHQCARRF